MCITNEFYKFKQTLFKYITCGVFSYSLIRSTETILVSISEVIRTNQLSDCVILIRKNNNEEYYIFSFLIK